MNGVFLIRTGPCYSCSCVILTHSIVNLRQSVRTYWVSLVVIITLNKHCATAAVISPERQYQAVKGETIKRSCEISLRKSKYFDGIVPSVFDCMNH